MQIGLDSELILSGRNGDRQALSALFERHYPSSLRIATRILRSDDDARDVVQSAYLAAFEHFGTFRGEAQFHTWLTRIVKNHCFMHLRRPERRRVCPMSEEGEVRDAVAALAQRTPTPEDLAWEGQLDAVLSSAAGKLPNKLREVYIQVSVLGFCIKEAAHALGLSIPATKTRLFRAHHRMRPELTRRLVVHSAQSPKNVSHGRTAGVPSQIAA